ncbi:MAG: methyl-accepting chemotaxis protein [Hoeflea sp.]|uniref:methyl-accepting chemotaxis protein n=1 Tax=Hoeflea sp. TaxID=1940281 RepID=UPI0032ECECA0
MKNLSIKSQSFISVGFVLTMLVVLAAVGYFSTVNIGGIFTDYRDTARQTVQVKQLVSDLYETRMASFRYRINPQDASTQSVADNVETLGAELLAVREAYLEDPETLATLDESIRKAEEYKTAFIKMTQLQSQRDAKVESVTALGKSTRETVTAMIAAALNDGDLASVARLTSTQENLLLGRLYFEKYLLANSQPLLDSARANLNAAIDSASALKGRLIRGVDPQSIASVSENISRYVSLVGEIEAIISERNSIRDEVLDVNGPAMQQAFNEIEQGALAVQDTLGPQGAATVTTTKSFMLIFSVFALIAGAVVSVFISNRLSRSISDMAGIMDRLAGGDFEAEIPNTDSKNEIGTMARALLNFKESGLDRIRLETESESNARMSEQERREREARKAEETKQLNRAVTLLGEGMSRLADGDLTVNIDEAFMDTVDQLRLNFNTAVEKLQTTLSEVRINSNSIDASSNEMREAVDELSRRTEQQAASLEETSAALDQITVTVRDTSARSTEAAEMSNTARTSTEESSKVVAEAVDAMGRIEKASSEISNIINVIDEIAFQTNLLALNAGVEAARAGEAGKGFAVVAQEVRELAQRSASAAKDIKELITKSGDEVDKGVELVQATGKALQQITGHVNQISAHIDSIATAGKEQSTGLQEINAAVNQMDQATQQNAAMVEEANAVTQKMSGDVAELNRQINQFVLKQNAAATSHPGAERPAPVAKPVKRNGPVAVGNAALKVEEWEAF